LDIIFGPIQSRRFGKSLGIDLSPQIKQCNYDCVYCELAPTQTTDIQTESLPVGTIVNAIQEALKKHEDIDVLTITANGEPTLYPYLGELIEEINKFKDNTKTLILSNGSTISDPRVQESLSHIDTVKLSLDCATQKCFKRIDRMHTGIDIEDIKSGMLEFKTRTAHPLIIEILIVKGINDKPSEIEALNSFLTDLQPDRIDLGTIDRPPAYDVKPVSYARLHELSQLFDSSLPVHITSRKNAPKKQETYSKDEILSTIAKRPLTPEDVSILFDDKSQKQLDNLLKNGELEVRNNNGVDFFMIPSKNN
jgi:wyosine [tRNA(Phe)-imidazoG37] synthetase (radical SAM superfamily)